MNVYWTDTFFDDEGLERCDFCIDEVRDHCERCDNGDHSFHPFMKQDGDQPIVNYNVDDEDHCTCCHLHQIAVSDEEMQETLASIRDAITRDASSRGVVSPSGQKE